MVSIKLTSKLFIWLNTKYMAHHIGLSFFLGGNIGEKPPSRAAGRQKKVLQWDADDADNAKKKTNDRFAKRSKFAEERYGCL